MTLFLDHLPSHVHVQRTGGVVVSVYKLENGRWRVQVRRKGFPTLDGVCATQRDAKAREAEFIAECSSAACPADVTLSAL